MAGCKVYNMKRNLIPGLEYYPSQVVTPWIHCQMAQSNAHSLTPFILWTGEN